MAFLRAHLIMYVSFSFGLILRIMRRKRRREMAKSLNNETTKSILELLRKAGISGKKITLDVDLDHETVEVMNTSNNILNDLLNIPNLIPEDKRIEVSEHIRNAREDWNR